MLRLIFGCSFANIVAPAAKRLDHFGKNGRGKRYSNEDERLVNGVGKGKLRQAGHTVEVVLNGRSTTYHVYKRPYVDHFLKKVR